VIVYPAIDLRRGKCVRLQQGEPEQETIYGDDPVAIAVRWQDAGAEWLHIVNLDGAFGGSLLDDETAQPMPTNLRCLLEITSAVHIPIQFGGGVRTLADVARLFELGVARVILGTMAVQQPELVSEAVTRFGPDRIAVGIDARNGIVATHGWQQTSNVAAVDLGREMHQRGVRWVIYTDISRDGMLSGVNVSATTSLAMQTGLLVIASGGVASLADLRALQQVETNGIAGVIIGKALYTGAVKLDQAIAAVQILGS
jgi:phosphoribosylformimino-5-aminoimidazole carboxamide ribotide isomerase